MKKIKVCQITTWKTGGAGIAASRLNESLNNKNIEVDSTLITKSKISELNKNEITARSYISELKSRLIYKKLYRKCIKKNAMNYEFYSFFETGYRLNLESFDIIHLHWVSNFIDLKTLVSKYSHKKIVWTIHDLNPFLGGIHYSIDYSRIDDDLKEYDFELMKLKHRIIKGQGIHFNFLSTWLYKEALKYAPWLKNEDVSFSVNGISPNLFINKNRSKVREDLYIDENKKNILFISESLSNFRKGIDLLLEAFDKDFINDNNIAIYAIGKKDIELDIPNIKFLGKISDFKLLQKYYQASDLFILPSRQDNLPNVMVESLCSGCPVVSFDTGGMKDWINKGNGIICDEISSNSLRKGVLKALNYEYDRDEISKNAIEAFTFNKTSKMYLNLYKKLLD